MLLYQHLELKSKSDRECVCVCVCETDCKKANHLNYKKRAEQPKNRFCTLNVAVIAPLEFFGHDICYCCADAEY